jgi:hypothetical protein
MATLKKPRASGPAAKTKTRSRRSSGTREKVQGEGDYVSAREFNQEERRFVESHGAEDLARRAAPEGAAEAAELDRAERKGKARARPDPETGTDNTVHESEVPPDDAADKNTRRGHS